jgi:hypothetical protein
VTNVLSASKDDPAVNSLHVLRDTHVGLDVAACNNTLDIPSRQEFSGVLLKMSRRREALGAYGCGDHRGRRPRGLVGHRGAPPDPEMPFLQGE